MTDRLPRHVIWRACRESNTTTTLACNSEDLTARHPDHPASSPLLVTMSLAALGLCAGSIYTFFLLWALLQERLTTTPYVSEPTGRIFTKEPQPEYFRSPLLLNWMQATFSTLIAALYLVFTASSSDKRPILDKFGLRALTPAGAASVRKANPTQQPKGKQQNGGPALPSKETVSPLLLRYLAISSLQSCSSQLGLHSLAHGISYPTLTLAKSCKLVPVLIMNVILYRRKFPLYKYMVVATVTVGISIFMLFSAESERKRAQGGGAGKKGDSLIGLALLCMNLIFDGATNSTQDDVFHNYSVTGPQMMLVMNALSSILMGASLVLPLHQIPLVGGMLGTGSSSSSSSSSSSELSTALAFIARHPQVVRDLFGYAAAGAIGQVAIFETLQRFGSLTLVSITVTRKLFTMLLSLVVYSHKLTTLQWAGVLLVFVGLGVEAHKKRQEGLVKRVLQQKQDQEKNKARVKDA